MHKVSISGHMRGIRTTQLKLINLRQWGLRCTEKPQAGNQRGHRVRTPKFRHCGHTLSLHCNIVNHWVKPGKALNLSQFLVSGARKYRTPNIHIGDNNAIGANFLMHFLDQLPSVA